MLMYIMWALLHVSMSIHLKHAELQRILILVVKRLLQLEYTGDKCITRA